MPALMISQVRTIQRIRGFTPVRQRDKRLTSSQFQLDKVLQVDSDFDYVFHVRLIIDPKGHTR